MSLGLGIRTTTLLITMLANAIVVVKYINNNILREFIVLNKNE